MPLKNQSLMKFFQKPRVTYFFSQFTNLGLQSFTIGNFVCSLKGFKTYFIETTLFFQLHLQW